MNNATETTNLWKNHSNELWAYFKNRVNNSSDAEDLLQELYIRIHINCNKISTLKSTSAWIYTIAQNLLIDYYRRKGIKPTDKLDASLAEQFNLESNITIKEGLQDLKSILSDIRKDYYQIIWSVLIQGESISHYATKHDLPINTVKSHLQRAKKILHERIETCCHLSYDNSGKIIDYKMK